MSSAFVSWIRHDVLSKQKTYVYNLNLTLANEFMEKNENLWKKKMTLPNYTESGTCYMRADPVCILNWSSDKFISALCIQNIFELLPHLTENQEQRDGGQSQTHISHKHDSSTCLRTRTGQNTTIELQHSWKLNIISVIYLFPVCHSLKL